MSRRKKETPGRRDFLKATGIMAGSVLLSACSEFLQAPTPTLSPSSTATSSPTPTQTPSPTSTSTPEPSPTPKPKPFDITFSAEGTRVPMKFPHTTVEGIGDVIDFERWQELPDLLNIAYLPYYHKTLLDMVDSVGQKWVKPFPADVKMPKWWTGKPLDSGVYPHMQINFPACDYDQQPIRLVGGVKLLFPTLDPDLRFYMYGITVQVVNPANVDKPGIATVFVEDNDFKQFGAALIRQTYYPSPIGRIPNDIQTNTDIAQTRSSFYKAYYLSQVGALKPILYNTAIDTIMNGLFPYDFCAKYPFVGGCGSFNHDPM